MGMSPQRAADIGWIVGVLGFSAFDAIREQEDIAAERTHLTGTTLSSTWRRGVAAIPHGRLVNRAVLVGLAIWLDGHIGDHLDDVPANW